MIKQEIIEKISKYFKLTSFEAEKIYDDIFAGIIKGVKEDNIADVTNLGEFIIKYNSGDENNKKTVEFLPTLSLEEEINQRAFEESRQFQPGKFIQSELTDKPDEKNTIPPVVNEKVSGIISDKEKNEIDQEHNVVEDEIKRRRDEILGKIIKPKEEIKADFNEKINESTIIPPVIIPPVTEKITEVTVEHIEAKKTIEEVINNPEEVTAKTEITEKTEITAKTEEISKTTEEIKSNITETSKEVEEVTENSFSDFFTEVSKEEHNVTSSINSTIPPVEPPVVPPVETVIPPGAVELHNQITGDQGKTNEYQTTITPMPFANGNGNGNGNGSGENYEHKLQDNSYYIWYKDSEPNSTDTQTMSYEYELLYQATKEAEYKSKLRIYVTTFIMFFSIVLILLIFSPVIYKYFFSPAEDQNSEEVQQETSSTDESQNSNQSTNQASVNSLESQPPVNNTTQEQAKQEVTPPVTQQEQPKQEAPKQEQPKQEAPKQEAPKQEAPKQEAPKQNSTQSVPGVTKSSMGWLDDYNKVIYVQLDNGKFTIQESAWDSDAKANKRISAVGGLVPGLKGSVLKVDLGSKGTWYRARFGEFSTIEEAKQKAEELRNKEKSRLHAMLLTFFLYA